VLDVWIAIGLCLLGVLGVMGAAWLVHLRRVRRVRHFDQPFPYDDKFNRAVITPILDWYILGHLADQRRLPLRQGFLEEDRERNAILNRYAAHLLARDGRGVRVVPSTLSESVRAPDADDYVPLYFPDDDPDDALAHFKHELIARRLVSTAGYLERIEQTRAEPLDAFDDLKPGCTPFVREAYTTFYNDLVAEADAPDRESGIREQIRALAVRMVFPARAPEFDYWKSRGLRTSQVPAPVARDAVQGWFYLQPDQVPLAQPPH